MKRLIEVALMSSVLLVGGCATKKYVARTIDPVTTKVNQIDKNQQQTQKQLEADEPKISAAAEKADSADSRATDALGRADAAGKKSDQVKTELRSELNERIANLDDYKAGGNAVVLFKYDSAQLTDEGKEELNQLATSQLGSMKRYFVAIQGFTDKTGSPQHNLDLSRRRAEAVENYLVAEKNVPVYRIQIVGLGDDKLVDEGRTREARGKNRRVEVTIFTADNSKGQAASTQTPVTPQQ